MLIVINRSHLAPRAATVRATAEVALSFLRQSRR
jgi:hypothetical protein